MPISDGQVRVLLAIVSASSLLWGLVLAHRDSIPPRWYDAARAFGAILLILSLPGPIGRIVQPFQNLAAGYHAGRGQPNYVASAVVGLLGVALAVGLSWRLLRPAADEPEAVDEPGETDDDEIGPLFDLPRLPMPPSAIASMLAISAALALMALGRVPELLFGLRYFERVDTTAWPYVFAIIVGLGLGAAVISPALVEEDDVPVEVGLGCLAGVAVAVFVSGFSASSSSTNLFEFFVAGSALGLLFVFGLRLFGEMVSRVPLDALILGGCAVLAFYIAWPVTVGLAHPRPTSFEGFPNLPDMPRELQFNGVPKPFDGSASAAACHYEINIPMPGVSLTPWPTGQPTPSRSPNAACARRFPNGFPTAFPTIFCITPSPRPGSADEVLAKLCAMAASP